MTKQFCDLCEEELSGENVVMVAKRYMSNHKIYCKKCFTDPKNWKIIQENALKKS